MRFAYLLSILMVLPAARPEQSQAQQQVYKWEDDQGRVELSDRPPTQPSSPVEVQPLPRLPPPAAVESADDDYYSIENQAKRLDEERQQREAARKEAERKRLEEQKLAAELEAARKKAESQEETDQGAGYPVYVRPIPPIHRPDRPIPPPRPPIPVPLPGGSIGGGRP